MKVADEIDILKQIVKLLDPLEDGARHRVVDYACKKFGIERAAAPTQTKELARPNPMAALPSGKPTAPQQYLRDYHFKTMTKRIGVLAVYLEREKGMKRFNFKDITDAFRDAKESKTPAQSQYARAVIMGYLAKEGDQFYATSKAEALVDAYSKNQIGETGEQEK